MNLSIIKYTPDPDLLVALAARRCYSSLPATAVEEALGPNEVERLLNFLRRRNHLSPFEHASFTFSVDGISRALSHQLVRHRMASYSQESQRYVEYTKLEMLPYVTPPRISQNHKVEKVFSDAMNHTLAAYRTMLKMGVPAEDARYVFPNAVETKLIFTLNARSLFNFFEQRCCLKAQWEIRQVAQRMISECRLVAPRVFRDAGAPCGYQRPFCRENDPNCPRYKGEFNSD